MSTPVNTSSTDSQMHNNIMAAGSKDRPPMLGPGRYSQWRSRFLRYIDTKPNGGGLKKCILNGPYVPTSVLIQAVPEAEGRPAVQQHTTIETVLNMTPENKEHFQSEKEAIFLLLTGIGDDIYSTVDACNTANEMWIAIERLQQGESLNVQDVKTNLFWEFGKFTSRDGESMESYYSRCLTFWQLFNLGEVNDIVLRRIAQKCKIHSHYCGCSSIIQDTYVRTKTSKIKCKHHLPKDKCIYQTEKQRDRQTNYTPSESGFSFLMKDSDLEQAQRDKNAKEFGTPCKSYNNDNQSRQFGNQRTMTVVGARETVGSPVVQQPGIQCFNCKGYGHYAKECRKPKRVKDYAYHKEKMMMCANKLKQGVPLQAEQLIGLTEESSSTGQPLEQVDQNAAECVDERAALANLIANLTLDTEENKTILKQLKKANASLTQEMEKCKTNLDETNSALGEAISCRDSCLIALQNKQNEFEKYKAFNDRTIDYEILQTKLNETLGLLALKDIEIKEGLKTKAYEISVLNQKHDELVKKSLLTRSQLEGYLKENTKVISDLKVKEDKDCVSYVYDSEDNSQVGYLGSGVGRRGAS
ncbi:retrovirus-related pol polyprotein from transposon TNT 1-94 [Tanacetum coccineum]